MHTPTIPFVHVIFVHVILYPIINNNCLTAIKFVHVLLFLLFPFLLLVSHYLLYIY